MALNKIQKDIRSSLSGHSIMQFEPASLESGAYPLDLEPTLNDESLFFGYKDNDGIPLARFPSYGDVYFPTRIAAFGLAHYNRFVIHKVEASRIEFFKAADWFLKSENGLWHYENDYGELKAPWISGMAQGEGISVLVRAFELSEDDKYRNMARLALEPLKRYKVEGGVRSLIDNKHEFIEEYPFINPHHTLNGFMYCLIGLLDNSEMVPEVAGEVGLDELVNTLDQQIHRWDIGYWTIYDIHKTKSGRQNAATMMYHRLHTSLLTYIAVKLENSRLSGVADRWNQYCKSPLSRVRALGAKVLYRIDNPHVTR